MFSIVFKRWKVLVGYINYIKSYIDLNVEEKAAINNNEVLILLTKFTQSFNLFYQTSADHQYYNKSGNFINYNNFILIRYFSHTHDLLYLKSSCIIWPIFVLLLKFVQVVISLNINNLLILSLVLSINIHLINI